jgi:hypothetical protein
LVTSPAISGREDDDLGESTEVLMKLPNSAGVIALAGAILVTVTSGITVAATAVSGPGYAACATASGTLALRHHGHCPKGYRKVTIGARGQRGEPGPAELTHMDEGYGGFGPLSTNDIEPTTVAVTPKLPAGRYDVTYTVDLEDNGTSADEIECSGMASDGLVMPANDVDDMAAYGHTDITDSNAVDLTHSSAISLLCYETLIIDTGQGGGGDPVVDFAHLVAVPVSGLN